MTVETPLMFIDKAATWRLAEQLGGQALVQLIVEHTHTCYLGERGALHAGAMAAATAPPARCAPGQYGAYLAAQGKEPRGGSA